MKRGANKCKNAKIRIGHGLVFIVSVYWSFDEIQSIKTISALKSFEISNSYLLQKNFSFSTINKSFLTHSRTDFLLLALIYQEEEHEQTSKTVLQR